MTDQLNNSNDKPASTPQDDKIKQPLRRLSDDELHVVLVQHGQWLTSEDRKERYGKRAILSDVDFTRENIDDAKRQWDMLRKANLSRSIFSNAKLDGADLYKINLEGASLSEASLKGTKLRVANLTGADLRGANITGAILEKAILKDVTMKEIEGLNKAVLNNSNFEGATDLNGTEFAGADITGVKLPADIKDFKVLDIVEETSKNARKIFLAMLLACVYSWLTIALTNDVALLTNSASSPLPIIGAAIPIAWFFWFAPVLLLGFYLYLHLYLQRLWKNLSSLPAIFEDGKQLDERAYPWLLNGLVRRHFEKLKSKRTRIDKFEEIVSIFLAWCVVPSTLFLFWMRYLPRHHWKGSILHIILIVLSIAIGVLFYRVHVRTLRRKKSRAFKLKYFWRFRRLYQSIAVILFACLLLILSYGSINGNRFYKYASDDSHRPEYSFLKSEVPRLFGWFGYNVLADIKYLDAYKAFLVNADLRNADLRGANLFGAKLRSADIRGANFTAVKNLTRGQLDEACGDSTTILPDKFKDYKFKPCPE